jgi:DNA-binding response OmpR family regulator
MAPKKILVAEDDKFLIKVYESKLFKEGYIVKISTNGEEALKDIKEMKPDLILLDLIMGKKNGFEVLAEMQKDSELRKIPVIILSNLGQDEDLKKGLDLGAHDYIIKSNASISEVVEKIERQLKEAERRNGKLPPEVEMSPVPTESEVKELICRSCNKVLDPDSRFCPRCGAPVEV